MFLRIIDRSRSGPADLARKTTALSIFGDCERANAWRFRASSRMIRERLKIDGSGSSVRRHVCSMPDRSVGGRESLGNVQKGRTILNCAISVGGWRPGRILSPALKRHIICSDHLGHVIPPMPQPTRVVARRIFHLLQVRRAISCCFGSSQIDGQIALEAQVTVLRTACHCEISHTKAAGAER